MSSAPLGRSSDVALSGEDGERAGRGDNKQQREHTDGVVELGRAPEERAEVGGHRGKARLSSSASSPARCGVIGARDVTGGAVTQAVTGFVTRVRPRATVTAVSPHLLVLDHVDDAGLPLSFRSLVCLTCRSLARGSCFARIPGLSLLISRFPPSPVARHARPPVRVFRGPRPQSPRGSVWYPFSRGDSAFFSCFPALFARF